MIDENFDSLNSYASNVTSNQTGADVSTAASQLERLVEATPAYRDYVRQGLVSLVSSRGEHVDDATSEYSSVGVGGAGADELAPFRLCALNLTYQLCRTYPCVFVVPRDTSDECIRKNAKCHRQNRLVFDT